MNCPLCNVELQMTERQGIEIDYCPKCRGVWLDRGELDKMIERAATYTEKGHAPHEAPRPHDGHHHPDDRGYHEHDKYHKKRRESFLSELFD